MQVIVVASRKGGSGKTSLTAHLAVEATRRGDGPVAAIDADPMAGLTGWFDARKADEPLCVEPTALQSRGLKATLAGLSAAGVQLVIVDTAPSASHDVSEVVAAADLVLIPVIPSPNDLRAIGETLDLIDEAGKPALFVVNNAAANAKLTKSSPDDPQPARHRSGGRRRPGDHTHANGFSELDDRWQDRRRTEGYQQIGRGDCQPLDRREGTIGKGKPPWPQNNRSRLTPYR